MRWLFTISNNYPKEVAMIAFDTISSKKTQRKKNLTFVEGPQEIFFPTFFSQARFEEEEDENTVCDICGTLRVSV